MNFESRLELNKVAGTPRFIYALLNSELPICDSSWNGNRGVILI